MRTLYYEATSRGDDAMDGQVQSTSMLTSHVGKFERTTLCVDYVQAEPRTQMSSCMVNLKHKHIALRPLVLAVLTLLISAGDHAVAASGRSKRSVQSVESRNGGDPILAIVSLRDQRITVYD